MFGMRDKFLTVLHAALFVQFAFAVYYDFMFTQVPVSAGKVHSAYGGKFKFLTFWDAVRISGFLSILVNKNFPGNKLRSNFQ